MAFIALPEFARIGIADHFDQEARNDLPRHAIFVLSHPHCCVFSSPSEAGAGLSIGVAVTFRDRVMRGPMWITTNPYLRTKR